MKLFAKTFRYLIVIQLIIVTLWSVAFYYSMMHEIYDSIDDGLDNYKLLIIKKAASDTSILYKSQFDESNYAIRAIPFTQAVSITDRYRDTLLYMPFEKKLEPVRILHTAFENNGKYYELKIISSMVEEDDLIKSLFWAVVILFCVLNITILSINHFVLKRIWKPFYKYLKRLNLFKIESDPDILPMKTDVSEFVQLNQSVDMLVKNSRKSYSNLKSFTENASHEIQTPLTSIIHHLELMLADSKLNKDHAQSAIKAHQSALRLSKINKALLLLTKLDNQQFQNRGIIDFEIIFNNVIDELSELAEFQGKTIEMEISGKFKHTMDHELASILVVNLVKNAIIHSLRGTHITIRIFDQQFSVENEGAHGPLPDEQIFTHFFKTENSAPGLGLGLAIVQSICRHEQFKIEYSFEAKHKFTVTGTK